MVVTALWHVVLGCDVTARKRVSDDVRVQGLGGFLNSLSNLNLTNDSIQIPWYGASFVALKSIVTWDFDQIYLQGPLYQRNRTTFRY